MLANANVMSLGGSLVANSDAVWFYTDHYTLIDFTHDCSL